MRHFKRYYIIYVLALAVLLSTAHGIRQQRLTAAALAEQNAPVCLVIDAGHGGADGGAVSCSGAKESDLNLEISLRLNDLCMLLGIPSKMLRTEDVMLCDEAAQSMSERKVSDLKRRVALVNETPNALLVSIHQNTFPEGKYAGAQTFYADTDGSKALAELLQDRLISSLDPSNHRVSKRIDAVYLMEHVQCTAILLECGFLTNPAEEARLRTADYQKKLACVIVSACTEYLENRT